MTTTKPLTMQAQRERAAAKSITAHRCMVCEERLNFDAGDVLEGVVLAGGPNHYVDTDAHFLAHYDCIAGWMQTGDAVMA